jgi:hypothetical protein
VQASTARHSRDAPQPGQTSAAAAAAAAGSRGCSTLQTLLNSSSVSQLLQQPPPARSLTGAAAKDVASCCNALCALAQLLHAVLSQQPTEAARHRVLAAVLQQQAAFSAGTLLSWVLQRPQQLQMSELLARCGYIYSPETLLLESSAFLDDLGHALPHTDRSITAQIMLQQLERSGDEPNPDTVYCAAPEGVSSMNPCSSSHSKQSALYQSVLREHIVTLISVQVWCHAACHIRSACTCYTALCSPCPCCITTNASQARAGDYSQNAQCASTPKHTCTPQHRCACCCAHSCHCANCCCRGAGQPASMSTAAGAQDNTATTLCS